MARELRLKDSSNQTAYKIEPTLDPNESTVCSVIVYGSTIPIDGHFLVYSNQILDRSPVTDVLGVVHSKEELSDKIYQCALEAGRRYAENLKCQFVDETHRAKEGKLAKEVDK